MNRNLLKEIILEQKKEIEKKSEGIVRENLKEIKKNLKLPHIVVISGIRRVGKSTLLLQIMRNFYSNKCYYFNFEDERLLNFKYSDFNLLYEIFNELFDKRKVFFFDEIQNVKGWENFVRRMQEKGFKFFITGSNASLLSKELGSKLTGRYIAYELYPFSFKEFLVFKGYQFNQHSLYHTINRAKIKRLFNQYLKDGGMPEYLKYKEKEIIKKIYENIIYRDIATRYDIKGVKALRELSLYYFSNIGSTFSYNNLKNILGLGSVNTIKSYTDFLENSYLIFPLNIYSYSFKKQCIASKKAYSIDNGITNAVGFRFSENKGQYLENAVFVELKRRGKEIYYYKTKNNLEIDFVTRNGSKIEQIIQVTQNMSIENVRQRELKSLTQTMNELKLKQGIILAEDEKEIIKIDGKIIKILPIYQYLLTNKFEI